MLLVTTKKQSKDVINQTISSESKIGWVHGRTPHVFFRWGVLFSFLHHNGYNIVFNNLPHGDNDMCFFRGDRNRGFRIVTQKFNFKWNNKHDFQKLFDML